MRPEKSDREERITVPCALAPVPYLAMHLLSFISWLTIDITIDPTMFTAGPFTITWHGFFTAVGILGGVTLSVWLARKDGIPTEVAQEIALVGVPCAIVGARMFYVFEHWDIFGRDLPKIVTGITEGGITLYGGLIGGVVGGLAYALYHRWPIAITFDAAAPGMLLGQAIGRLGDLINGEHLAARSSLPWAVKYLNPNSPQFGYFLNHPDPNHPLNPLDTYSVHPTAGGYELVGDLIIIGILLFVLRRFIKVPGWLFASYMAIYAIMRFFLSYFRIDEQRIWDIPVPQLVSGLLVGLAIMVAGVLMRWPGPITPEYAERVWGEEAEPDDVPRSRRRRKPATTA